MEGSLLREGGVHPKIKQVLQLLKDMKATIDEDAAADAKTNEKMECWCRKNDRSLSEAQKASQDRIKLLSGRITSNKALVAQRATELKQVAKEIAEVKASLKEETARYNQQTDSLHEQEGELKQAVTQMSNAMSVLSKHQTGLAQQETIINLRNHLKSHTDLLDGLLPGDKSLVMGFLQQAPAMEPTEQRGGYNTQSGEVFGILQQMLEQFQSDLEGNLEEQAKNKEFHAANIKRLDEELAAREDAETRFTKDKAEANQSIADDGHEIEDLEAKMGSDAKFLAVVKEKCPKHRAEYEKRTEERALEVEAIQTAQNFLNSDKGLDTFAKMPGGGSVAPSFVQVRQTRSLTRAKRILRATAARFAHVPGAKSTKLSMLSNRMGLDSFATVKKAIEKMVEELKEQRADEGAQKDECVKNLQQSEKNIKEVEGQLEVMSSSLEEKALEKSEAAKELKDAVEGLVEVAKSKTDLREERNESMQAFQRDVADQNAAIELLENAMSALSFVYANNKPTATPPSFLQQEPAQPLTHTDAPELEKDYNKSQGGNVVLAMLQEIVNDAKDQIKMLNKTEEDNKATYSVELAALNEQKNVLTAGKTTMDLKVSQIQQDIEDLEADQKEKLSEAMNLDQQKQNYHLQCDFLLKNFDLRQESISDEIEALHQVSAILSGAKFGP